MFFFVHSCFVDVLFFCCKSSDAAKCSRAASNTKQPNQSRDVLDGVYKAIKPETSLAGDTDRQRRRITVRGLGVSDHVFLDVYPFRASASRRRDVMRGEFAFVCARCRAATR